MKQLNNWKNPFKKVIAGFAIVLLLLAVNNAFAQKRGEKTTVSKSATVDFKTMEKYSKEHPTDPNERRIPGTKNGANEGREEGEEEEELPILKRIPKGARIVKDPFGKMISPLAGKPLSGINSQAPFTPITNFSAIDDVGSVIPPDVGGQVGPNHIMTTLNGTGVRIQSRTGTIISTVTLNAFFASVGAPSTFDPKVMYDPYNSRWIVVACGNAQSANSALLIGVSATNDPTGTWKLYSLDVDAANVDWFDYPSIGFTKDWVVITGNMFKVANNAFSTGKLYAYKKSDLYAALASPSVTSINGEGGMCPAITYDNSISTMYVLVTGGGNSGGNGFIGVSTLTGAVGSEVLSATTYISTPNPWADGAPAANFAPQSGTTNKVACNDTRMQKVIYRNGSIWATHTVFLPAASPTRSSIQWWQLSTTPAVLQIGRIDDASGANFYAFPSIDVNKNNDAMIGCAKFSGTTFPSACYALRMASDPVNTFQADVVYKAGLANYFKTFSGTTNRWGDYTSVCVDPIDDMNFWTVQEYARTGNTWGTWWAGICTPPPTPGTITTPSTAYANSQGNEFSVAPVSGATSYTWTFPAGCTITAGLNTNSVTVTLGSTSGSVTVVANKTGCNSDPQTKVLTIQAAPTLVASASNNSPLCEGGTLNLFSGASGGVPPYSYSWTGPNAFISTAQNPTIANVPFARAGLYTVTVTDSRSPAVSVTAQTTVVINPAPVISASVNPAAICSGGNAQLTAYQYSSANSTPPTYCTDNLSTYDACAAPGGSNISNVAIASTTLNSNTVCNYVNGSAYTNYPASGNTTATLITGQTYTISVTNAENSVVSMWIDYNRNGTFETTEHTQVFTSGLSGSVSFTVPSTATLGATKMRVRSRNTGFPNGAGDACSTFGSGTVEEYTITIANTDIASYVWSPTTFLNATTGSSVAAIGANSTTTYTVTATSAAGCVSSATTTLTVNPSPTISAVSSLYSICLGVSPTLTANATAGPQASLVYAAPGGTDNSFNDHITLVQFNTINNPSGAGGSSYEDFTGIVPATTVNVGQTISLTINVADGGGLEFAAAWFDWNRNGVYEPSEFVNVPPLGYSGSYYSGTVSVTVPASAVAGVIHMRVRSQYNGGLSAGMAYTSYTYGETEEYLVNVFRPAVSYMWYPGAIAGNPITVTPTTTTLYKVVGTDANGCISDTASVVVTSKQASGIDNITAANNPICSGTTTTLTANGVRGDNALLTWFTGPGGTGTNLGSTPTIAGNPGTTYYARVTSSCGDAAEASLKVIGDIVKPTITCPSNISVNNSIGCSKSVIVPDPVYADNCTVSSLIWSTTGATTLTSGTGGLRVVGTKVFNNGITTVSYSVRDNAARTNTCSFTVSVVDNAKPAFTSTPSGITQNVTSGCVKNILIPAVTFADNCGTPVLSWAASGATNLSGVGQIGTLFFNVGKTKVTYTLTDIAGNAKTTFFNVTLRDLIAPTITCPATITTTTTSTSCTRNIAIPDPVFGDNCFVKNLSWTMSGATTVASPLTGIRTVGTKTFNKGLTVITFTASDSTGNIATCSTNVQLNSPNTCPSITMAKGSNIEMKEAIGLKVKISPNPTTAAFALQVRSESKEAVNIIVYNSEGKKIQQFKTANLNNILFGEKYTSGSYLIEVRQGDKRTTVIGVKQ